MSPDPCNGHHQLSAGLYTVNISRTVPLLLVHLNIFSPSHHPDCQCDIVCNKLGNWLLTRWSSIHSWLVTPVMLSRVTEFVTSRECPGKLSGDQKNYGIINMKAWTVTIACSNNCCLVRKESHG